MRTIAFLNQKGGTGKTVSAASFGRSLAADHGQRVLMIDADFQGNLSQYFRVGADETNSTWTLLTSGAGYWEEFTSDTTEERIHIIPADMTLANADMPGSCAKPWAMRDLIEVLQEDDAYDYCIIDCHPYFGVITQAALLAADEVIVPLRLETFSTDGVREILQQLRIKAEAGRAFDGQNGGHDPLFHILPHIPGGKRLADHIGVQRQLMHQRIQFRLEHRFRGNLMPIPHVRRGKTGKALGIAAKLPCPFQVDMQFILPQKARGHHILAQQTQGGITMQVKHRNIHWNASSI